MSELRVGDSVRAGMNSANLAYFDEVYFFGHADPVRKSRYIVLKLTDGASLEISPQHFVPKCPLLHSLCKWSERTEVYAKEIEEGDYVWALTSNASHTIGLQQVLKKSSRDMVGLYNPYTLSGHIVVNGVLASAHSNWILDAYMPSSLTGYLPTVYQMLFTPGRILYHIFGPTAADYLDMNNPQVAPEKNGYGPEFLMAVLLAFGGLLSGCCVIPNFRIKR